MYHYVRPIACSQFPRIKGLELEGFKRQLDFFSSRFNFVTAQDVVSAARHDASLPERACWLTFDDGYKDHHSHVLPELLKRGIQGAFFPPVQPITERTLLDVNSVHFILASTENVSSLVFDLKSACLENGISAQELRGFWETYAVPSRYDTREVIFFKRMLQHALPESLRSAITSILFEKYVGVGQSMFADGLYMSVDEVKELINAGMYVGSHGNRHLWMNKEDYSSQEAEIVTSIEFLKKMGAPVDDWIMCFPFGAYNQDTLELLGKHRCAIGITTEVAKADMALHHPLQLPRFDTNDFPQ